jgi:hypothetical protein
MRIGCSIGGGIIALHMLRMGCSIGGGVCV